MSLPKSRQVDLSRVYPLEEGITEQQRERREAIQSFKKTEKSQQDELTLKNFIEEQEVVYNRIPVEPSQFDTIIKKGMRVAYINNNSKDMKPFQRGKPRIGGIVIDIQPEYIVLRNPSNRVSWSVQRRFVKRWYVSREFGKMQVEEDDLSKVQPLIPSKPSNFPIIYKGQLIKFEPSEVKRKRFMAGRNYRKAVEEIDARDA